MSFQSTHKLEFLVAPWITEDFTRFKIGTVNGIWTSTKNTYDILGIDNDCPGNGHFDDVFEWFENSCKRDKKDFRILEVWNKRLRKHLTEKRGFVLESKKGPSYIKKYKTIASCMN